MDRCSNGLPCLAGCWWHSSAGRSYAFLSVQCLHIWMCVCMGLAQGMGACVQWEVHMAHPRRTILFSQEALRICACMVPCMHVVPGHMYCATVSPVLHGLRICMCIALLTSRLQCCHHFGAVTVSPWLVARQVTKHGTQFPPPLGAGSGSGVPCAPVSRCQGGCQGWCGHSFTASLLLPLVRGDLGRHWAC